MIARWQFWTTTVVAVVAAAAAVGVMVLFSQNRALQADVAVRAQYIQQSVQFEGVYRELVKALADLSLRNQDKALADLLASQGITVSGPTATPAPSASEPKKGARP